MSSVRRLLRRLGWALALATAIAAGIATSSATMLYMQAGMRGLRMFGTWWWWNYLRVTAPYVNDHLVNSILCGMLAFGAVMLVPCVVAWRVRQQSPRPLYGTTAWATDEEIKRAGFDL